jgi:hypothetical protein
MYVIVSSRFRKCLVIIVVVRCFLVHRMDCLSIYRRVGLDFQSLYLGIAGGIGIGRYVRRPRDG